MSKLLDNLSGEQYSGDVGCVVLGNYVLFVLLCFLSPHGAKWLPLILPGLIVAAYLLWLLLAFIVETALDITEGKAQKRRVTMPDLMRHCGWFAARVCLLLLMFTPMVLAVLLWR